MATSVQDTKDMHDYIGRVFDAKRAERAHAVERLLAEMLDFGEPEHRQLSLEDVRDKEKRLPKTAKRLGQLGGVHALYIELPKGKGERVRQREAEAVAKEVQSKLGDEMLLIFSDYQGTQLNWIYPEFKEKRPTLRRIAIEAGTGRRTAVVQLAKVYDEYRESKNIEGALSNAFDVEPVTKSFFKAYKHIFDDAMERITGIDDENEKHLFVQTLFNRLMFVYFLSRKRWLSINGNTDYLNALFTDYGLSDEDGNFYADRLDCLFFDGLNNAQSRDLASEFEPIIGEVPFLNGGLFDKKPRDESAQVPDDVIVSVLRDLFDAFNFTVMESTPYDIEIAVDPEMLGKVFEELVTGRNEKGAYYTPRPVVSFMCREALKGYLKTRVGLDDAVADAFVDERETAGINYAAARRVVAALDEVTVVDPACGSGAYLLGMMQELVELQQELIRAGANTRSLHDLKLAIIERNLYGGDIDEFAVNLAMLRLWLSLAIEYDGPAPEPLPNLDFKILLGDSLLAPNPAPEGLHFDALAIRESGLAELKARYLRETVGTEKDWLRGQIEEAESKVRQQIGEASVPECAIDWRIECAEVFADGGFDIAIANPPYIQIKSLDRDTVDSYERAGYQTFLRSADIFQLFFERGCEILKQEGGVLSYVTSNSWLRSRYGEKLRSYFSKHHRPSKWLDLGTGVFGSAIVDPGILTLETNSEAGAFPAADMDWPHVQQLPPEAHDWGLMWPDSADVWFALSPKDASVMTKIRTAGTPVRETNAEIRVGVITGYNDAFILDQATRDALLTEDPQSGEIIEPVLRGRQVRRWYTRHAGSWLVSTFPARRVDISHYPGVKKHLLSFGKKRLEQSGATLPDGRKARKKTSHKWYETSDTIEYHEHFARPKLLWIELADKGRFTYDESGIIGEATTFMLTDGGG